MKNPFAHIKKQVAQQVQAHIADQGEQYFLLAVSGGPDSVLLAHVFAQLGLRFCLAHVNYGLRGRDSRADETFVRALAEQLQVKCFVHRADRAMLAKAGESLQMKARDIRYLFFDRIHRDEKTGYTVLGHQANDQAETLLLNFFRGCGLDGLRGMKVLDGQKFRPLLGVQKADILRALEEKKLAFRTDQSNLGTDYKRNYLRHTVIPAIEKKWPGIQKTLLDNISRFGTAAAALENTSRNRWAFEKNFTFHTGLLAEPAEADAFYKAAVKAGFTLRALQQLLGSRSTETKTLAGRNGMLEKKAELVRFIRTAEESPQARLSIRGNQVSVSIPGRELVRTASETIDAGAVKGPLVLRPWQAGDKMIPLGMKGFKKISDLLTGLKLPLSAKKQVYVLCDSEKIVWLVGFRIDERVKRRPGQTGGQALHLHIR